MPSRRPPRTVRVVEGERVRRGVYVLPSLLTTCGLFAGFYSVIATLRGEYALAAVAVMIANVFDVLDGRVARVTNSASRFGIEYDSLSDLVAFGVAPAVLIYQFALVPWGSWGWLAAALFVTCGALRLARFNVQFESADKRDFAGLPVPAAAEVIAATVLLLDHLEFGALDFRMRWLLVVVYALAGLMVSNLPYFSFKEFRLTGRQPFSVLVGIIILLSVALAVPQLFLFVGFAGYALSGPLRWGRARLRRGGTAPAAEDAGEADDDDLTGAEASSSNEGR